MKIHARGDDNIHVQGLRLKQSYRVLLESEPLQSEPLNVDEFVPWSVDLHVDHQHPMSARHGLGERACTRLLFAYRVIQSVSR